MSDVKAAEHGLLADEYPGLYKVIDAAGEVHSKGMQAYLIMMASRLIELKRVLKPTGSIYLHCDPTASHYLKMLMDALFGRGNFRNEIVWHYGKMSNSRQNFPRNHDIVLRYTKTNDYVFLPIKGGESEYRTRYERYLIDNKVLYGKVKTSNDKLILRRIKRLSNKLCRGLEDTDILFDFDKEFKIQSDVIYVPIIKGNSSERTGYPTQKPLALLDRIIKASSNPGDIVMDPFCGCATTLVAAHNLERQWIGIDISPKAVDLVQMRLKDAQRPMFSNVIARTDIPKRTDVGDTPNYRTHKHTLFGLQEGLCAGCNIHFPFRNMTIDHVVPQSKGGTDHIENLQLLCNACNSMKGTKTQAEFIVALKEAGLSSWLCHSGP